MIGMSEVKFKSTNPFFVASNIAHCSDPSYWIPWTDPSFTDLFLFVQVVYNPSFTNRYTMGYLQRLSTD